MFVKSIVHVFPIVFLLITNVVMGQLAVLDDVRLWDIIFNSWAASVGLILTYTIVYFNFKLLRFRKSLYFISILSLLYLNYTMSLIAESENYFMDAYLNLKVFFIALAATLFVLLIQVFRNKQAGFFLNKFTYKELDSIGYYALISFIVLEANVIMEIIHRKSLDLNANFSISNFYNIDVVLVAFIGIIITIFYYILFDKYIKDK